MTKKLNVPNNPDSDSSFWIFRILAYFGRVCFGFRASDFEFISQAYWHGKFIEVVLFNISKVRI
jgi:hypothetical protein